MRERSSLLVLRPVSAVHCLPRGSEACPISLTHVLGRLVGWGGVVPVVAAPLWPVARAALVAAAEADALIGLLAPPSAPAAWFKRVLAGAGELAPRLPFFTAAEVRVEAGGKASATARLLVERLVDQGLTHLVLDGTALPAASRGRTLAEVAAVVFERELAIECVLPAAAVVDPELALEFVADFEAWGLRPDFVSARTPLARDAEEAAAQLRALEGLAAALGDHPLVRRGPLAPALRDRLRGSAVRLSDDGGAALHAGRPALPADAAEAAAERELPAAVTDRLEALAYGEVAALIEALGAAGSASAAERGGAGARA